MGRALYVDCAFGALASGRGRMIITQRKTFFSVIEYPKSNIQNPSLLSACSARDYRVSNRLPTKQPPPPPPLSLSGVVPDVVAAIPALKWYTLISIDAGSPL